MKTWPDGAILTFAFMSVQLSCRRPWNIVVERQTFAAVNASRVVLANAFESILEIVLLFILATTRVTITLASASYGNVADGIVVGSEHLRIVENFIAKRVEAIERDADVRGCDPFLELSAVLKVVSARPVLKSSEDDGCASERSNIAELVRAQSDCFVVVSHDDGTRAHAISSLTAGTVVLVWNLLNRKSIPGSGLRITKVNKTRLP